MFDPLIIHNDNTSLINECKKELLFNLESFDFGNSDLDTYISENFIPKLLQKEFNILFIKDNLSGNYLELYGILLAYHIRLSDKLGKKIQRVPIIILSDIDGYILNRIDPMANILFTKNIFVSSNDLDTFGYFEKEFQKIVAFQDYKKEFIDLIHIEQPKDYLSDHDISNEWNIDRWADILNVKSSVIQKNKTKIENMLYYKYLQALYPATISDEVEIKKLMNKGKVLLIDDEWDKGWGDVLDIALNQEGINFTIFKEEFRDKQSLDELNLSQIKIPDVLLLDLRLVAADRDHNRIEEYSSIKILEKLHKFNPGIQVIMLTATGKSTRLEKLYKKHILGYVKKEHPNDISIDTVANINKLIQLVDKGLGRKYLISVWQTQQEILNYNLFQDLDSEIESERKLLELKNSISTIFDTLNSNLPNTFVFGMLELYKCLEIINDYYIYEAYDQESKKMKAYWIDGNTLISNNGNKSVNNKIKNILVKLSLSTPTIDDIIDELSCSRNYQIHSNGQDSRCEGKIIYEPNHLNIREWFDLIKIILSKVTKA